MLEIATNMLLKSNDDEHIYRVLWVSSAREGVYLFDLDTLKLPFYIAYSLLLEQVADGSFSVQGVDPYFARMSEDDLTDKEREIRDALWNKLESVITDEPRIFIRKERGALLSALAKSAGIDIKNLYDYLKVYWKRGKTKNAFIPQYSKRGGAGKEREVTNNTKKRGRPREYTDKAGINIDDKTVTIFEKAVKKYFHKENGLSFKATYNFMLKDHYTRSVTQTDGSIKMELLPEETLPSLGQFRYWYNKKYDAVAKVAKRERESKFSLNHRAILGKSDYGVMGPGAQYQIDATIGDIYLVSQFNRAHIIGRPVIYFVIDVFSRMVTGMYVGLEGPSWAGSMMALANAATDKVKYCAEYEIVIKNEEWPCHHIPDAIIADRGEMESKNADMLASGLGIRIENKAPYRADLKGIVEQFFHTINEEIVVRLPGHVKPDMSERGGHDYRLDAKLTIRELTQILIHTVLQHNNVHYLNYYERTADMIKDDVKAIPIKLWNWGIARVGGALRVLSDDIVKLYLMPTDTATVTEKGIKYRGLYYTCGRAKSDSWFEHARITKNFSVDISFDRRDMSTIYVRRDRGTLDVCWLLEHNEKYAGKCLEEILNLREIENALKQKHEVVEIEAEVNSNESIEKIVAYANEETNKTVVPASKKGRTAEIRDNRHMEKAINRVDEAFNLLGEKKSQAANEDSSEIQDDTENDTENDIMKLVNKHLEDSYGDGHR